jgi:hypothetical protein
MVVMTLLSMFIGLIVAVIWSAIRIERADASVMTRMLVQNALAEQFREDVAGAVETLKEWEEHTAGSQCLILRRPDGSHVVYAWQNKQLSRLEKIVETENKRLLPAGAEQADVEFRTSGSENRLVTLRLTETRGPGPKRLLEIAAALGGDVR